jgi:hypothetical protein
MEVEDAETDEVGSHHQKASHDRAHSTKELVFFIASTLVHRPLSFMR